MIFHERHKIKLLEGVPLFEGCTHTELAHVAKRAEEVSFEDGSALMREGRGGHQFLVIAEGEAEVLVNGEHMGTAGPGEHLGEVSLLLQTSRTATVIARGPVHALAMDEQAFRAMLDELPSIRARVDGSAFERLGHLPPDHPGD